MLKVAIANDTLIALEILRRVIETDPYYELLWTAKNGAEAIALCQQQRPDIMLMDLLMPGIDGVAATRQIMAQSPCAILLVTGSVEGNTSKVFEAMGQGALDVVGTPKVGLQSDNLAAAALPLLTKMDTVSAYIGKPVRGRFSRATRQQTSRLPKAPELIVIGASTGGPKAIAEVLRALPAHHSAAIVVVQHLDAQFVPGFVQWLDGQVKLPVSLVRAGDQPSSGTVMIADGAQHLSIDANCTFRYHSRSGHPDDVLQNSEAAANQQFIYCPSVDIFFQSVARYWPNPGKAVLLTGMGADGAAGMSHLQTAGWHTIAQSEASCAVYGMPKAAIARGAAKQILSLSKIARILQDSSNYS